jgi:A/G-specific adenine glycosylase
VNARDLPWRRTRDPYAIWVSEIMLQQTQVKTVIPYWNRWMREFPTVRALATAPADRVLKLWEGLGYYTRARNLQRAALAIVASREAERRSPTRREPDSTLQRAGSETSAPFPCDLDAILALPGIGRYTAGAICSIAFNQPTPVLDGNVIRVLTRLFGITANPRDKAVSEQLWSGAAQLVRAASHLPDSADSNCSHLNQAMMELGATLCTPRQPRCSDCPWRRPCVARQERCQETLPSLGKRVASTARVFQAFVIERNGRVLLRQRPAGVVNAGLWEFPNAEAGSWQEAARQLGLPGTARVEPVCEVRHSITRYRIRLLVWRVKVARPSAIVGDGCLFSLKAAGELAFTAAHRKAFRALPTVVASAPSDA